jgi:hypothetical protein
MYYRARYYDPAIGRFISADTIVPNPENPQDLNRYAYVRNNPLKYTDPSGHCVTSSGAVTDGDASVRCGVAVPQFTSWSGSVSGSRPTRSRWDPRSWFNSTMDAITGSDAGDYADLILEMAQDVGIDPLLLWAIIEHESRNNIPGQFNIAEDWAKDVIGDASIGLAQMQLGAFEETLRRHPELSDGRDTAAQWRSLALDDEQSIVVAAYHLADLSSELSRVEPSESDLDRGALIMVGWVTGENNMLLVATGDEPLGPMGAAYIGYVSSHYQSAYDFYCNGGYECG